MNDNEYLAGIIRDKLEQGQPLVLASIVGIQGSSPRHTGTRMAVDAEGRSYGTIGGSLLEYTAVRQAGDVLAERRSRLMDFDLTGKDASADGMICGGKARLLLDYLSPGAENAAFFRCWHDAARGGQEFFCLTRLEDTGESIGVAGRSLLFPDGKVVGSPLPDIGSYQADLRAVSAAAVLEMENARLVVERIRPLKTLYCFGAGHVAVPTAHIAALAGFRVVVTDDRADYATAERFPDAAEVRLIADFDRALDGLTIDADSCIIILTRSHQYDRAVLGQAVKTNAGYVGMISSRRKREAIYAALMEEGVTQPELDRVHSPIGIAIGGETPEEIAVSIVGELISHRAGLP